MESSEVEALQLEIIGLLCTLPVESLKELCDFLTIAGSKFEHVTGKNRTSLILMISNHLQSEEFQMLEDLGMSELLCFKDKITELQAEATGSSVKELKVARHEQQNEFNETLGSTSTETRPFQSHVPSQIKHTHEEDVHKVQTDMSSLGIQASALRQAPAVWHKEFKISGQIGDPGQKDRLTFSSLARQIEHGLLKGFPETEIVDAVIRAIVPGMQLRSYLEGKNDLTLPTLRRILRCHYQEKSATELYKQLSSEAQSVKETPQSFLIRTLDLRQKILFASQESESGLRYDPVLVQNMFLHTVMTGLLNDNIKRDLQPSLEQAGVSDELLFEKLNIACAYESERQDKKKMHALQRSVTVHSAQSDHTTTEKKDKISQSSHIKSQTDILSELQEMKANITLLKDLEAEVSSIKESMQQPSYLQRQHPNPVSGPDCTPAQSVPTYHNPSLAYKPAVHPDCHQAPPVQYSYLQPPPAHHNYLPPVPGQHDHLPPNQRYGNRRPLSTTSPRPRRRCYACQQENLEDCIHCFRCGSSEHFSAGCRMRRSGQFRGSALNEQGLPQRGRE